MRRRRSGAHRAAEAAWASHEIRAQSLLAGLDPVLADGTIGPEQVAFAREWVERVVARSPETVGSALMLLVRRAGDHGWGWWHRQQAAELARHRYVVSADDALLAAWTAVRAPDSWYAGQLLRVVEGMLRRTVGPVARSDAAVSAIRALVDSVDRRRSLSAVDRSAARTRLLKLLPAVSNRFAAHVLHYQQAYALFKQRGWIANYLGPYDGGYHGQARHDFPDAGLTAVFEHLQADAEAGQDRVELCTTDRVWFFWTADRAKAAVPLERVPSLVFSEAMRDVDLLVGVSSIALDPNWADRGDDPYYDYWLHTSFGPLSATAEVRRDVLARLLPKMTIADRVELGDRSLRVRGNLGTYKVHLGSANILIEPDDRYLCIVPANAGRTRRVMLPFEGDEVLGIILSKALLLAADDKITDPTILRQLQRRA